MKPRLLWNEEEGNGIENPSLRNLSSETKNAYTPQLFNHEMEREDEVNFSNT